MPHDLPLVTTIAAAFAAAWLLGIAAHRIGLSPLVGYLLAGIAIGPFTPGYSGDVNLASQLAEIGVVLLMFGVGLHFHPRDLLQVRGVAVPGALVQSGVATVLGVVIGDAWGWSPAAGLIFGMSLAVASTVVLMRVLEDRDLLDSVQGHVAVGWLIVEDVLTVVALVVLPVLGESGPAAPGGRGLLVALAVALAKLAVLATLVLVGGARLIPRLLRYAAGLRSRELFTLTVLAVAVAVAVGSSIAFGASMALGAFLAGIVVGQSPVGEQAAADALPLRDAFAVLFFVAAGMLFDPAFLVREPLLVLAALAVVLLAKPLVALVVVALLGYSGRTALVVALGLAQIGEFSFILGQIGREHGLLAPGAYHAIVAAALLSIALNPLLFGRLDAIEAWLRARPRLWRGLNARAERRGARSNARLAPLEEPAGQRAVIVGYGPVGRSVDDALRRAGLETVVVDMNLDTVTAITDTGRRAVYGDASRIDILKAAGVPRASHLVVTLPHSLNRRPLVTAARQLNPGCHIVVRARYLREAEDLEQAGADAAFFEEAAAAVALTTLVLRSLGRDKATLDEEAARLRTALGSEVVYRRGGSGA